MFRLTRNPLWIGAATLCCVLVAVKSLQASISTIKGKGKYQSAFLFVNNNLTNATNTDAVTVPSGQTLVITDFIFSNNLNAANGLVMKKQKVDTNTVDVIPFTGTAAAGSFSHSFSTGIEFGPGEHVLVRTVNGAGGVSLNGYFKK